MPVGDRTGPLSMARLGDLQRFHEILASLVRKVRGGRTIAGCSGGMNWPDRGIYRFRERHEERSSTGNGPRIVRVGTHALKVGSRTTLWKRLSQHRGTIHPRGFNHRGSIFRSLVGKSLIERDGLLCPSWGKGSSAPRSIREAEVLLEREVSAVLGAMPFLWLAIKGEPGPDSLRGYFERNGIRAPQQLWQASARPAFGQMAR